MYSVARNDEIFYRDPVADAFGESHFISILQFSAEGDAPGDGGDL